MTVSRAWLLKSVETVAVMAALAFLGALITGGLNFSVTTLHAAVLAGYTAAVTALQSIFAGIINPPAAPTTALATTALKQRVLMGKGPVAVGEAGESTFGLLVLAAALICFGVLAVTGFGWFGSHSTHPDGWLGLGLALIVAYGLLGARSA